MLLEQPSDPRQSGEPADQATAHDKRPDMGHVAAISNRLNLERLVTAHERTPQVLEGDPISFQPDNFHGAIWHRARLTFEPRNDRVFAGGQNVGVFSEPATESLNYFIWGEPWEMDGVVVQP
jgi:hypothetical protein